MGTRPLRRAIQRYIEDPLADEVLRAGEIKSGTTVLVERNEAGDDEDMPLKLKLVKPRKKPAAKKKKAKEPAAVGGRSGGDEPEHGEEPPVDDGPSPEDIPKADASDPRGDAGDDAPPEAENE
jgi:hypothetical protein